MVHWSSSLLYVVKSPLNLNCVQCNKVRYIALAILHSKRIKLHFKRLVTGKAWLAGKPAIRARGS